MAEIRKNYHYYSGKQKAKELFSKKYSVYVSSYLPVLSNIAETCLKYGGDKSLHYTKKGKPLTPELRDFYCGYAEGVMDIFGKVLVDTVKADDVAFIEMQDNVLRRSKYKNNKKK